MLRVLLNGFYKRPIPKAPLYMFRSNYVANDTVSQVELVNEEPEMQINYSYVLNKIAQAQRNNNTKKVDKWGTFINNIGKLSLSGSRTPVQGTPAWVTLEVAVGGFATGGYMAGGELQEHEKELYKFLFNEEAGTKEEVRERLNNEMLSPAGLDLLSNMLYSQQYEIKVPEEGALLTFVYLVQNNRQAEATNLLDQIKPFFSQLRFYPIPSEQPLTLGAEVSVNSSNEVYDNLQNVETREEAIKNRDVCKLVLPSYDKLLSAVLLSTGGNNPPKVVKVEGKNVEIEGDLPFEVTTEEIKTLLKTAVRELESYNSETKNIQAYSKRNLGLLLTLVKKFLTSTVTPRNREVARKILATYAAKHGYPGSESHTKEREKQKQYVAKIGIVDDFARVLSKRLAPYKDLNKGIDIILAPVQNKEVQGLLEANMEIPKKLKEKINRAKIASIEQLCKEGLVPSSEVLAILCPTLVASVQSTGSGTREEATLYGAIYRAFKTRRSLLLLNLASQVKIEELPWVAALQKNQNKSQSRQDASKATLEDVVVLTLTHWPETIIPNKLIGVLQDLSVTAKSSSDRRGWPLLKELAADIFCFKFSQPFLTNALIASEQLQGSLYETYYKLDFAKIAKFKTTSELDDMCVKTTSWGKVAENGMAIERCMLATTHNLAFLFKELNLKSRLSSVLPSLARRIFNFVVKSTSNLAHMDWKTRLQIIKNAGFAWRQMVYFLAQMETIEVKEFFLWAKTRLEAIKDEPFRDTIARPLEYL